MPWVKHGFSELHEPYSYHSNNISQFREKLELINGVINRVPYVDDLEADRKNNYWATPREFYNWGGDCKDSAVAKYYILRKLGVSDKDMFIHVVWNKLLGYHAILVITYNKDVFVLDNLNNVVHTVDYLDNFNLIYKINRLGWTND